MVSVLSAHLAQLSLACLQRDKAMHALLGLCWHRKWATGSVFVNQVRALLHKIVRKGWLLWTVSPHFNKRQMVRLLSKLLLVQLHPFLKFFCVFFSSHGVFSSPAGAPHPVPAPVPFVLPAVPTGACCQLACGCATAQRGREGTLASACCCRSAWAPGQLGESQSYSHVNVKLAACYRLVWFIPP